MSEADITGSSGVTGAGRENRSNALLGLLPYIGLLLFLIASAPLLVGERAAGWQVQLVENGVHYLIGWASIGAAISHLFFGRAISRSIGWNESPFERELGFAALGFGVVGLMAVSQPPAFWLAVIVANAIFRCGCGIGHIYEMVRHHNFAINNTAILFVNFVVPLALLVGYHAWLA